MDPHPLYQKFAEQLTGYCTNVQKGDQVIIHAYDMVPKSMVIAIIQAVRAAGGNVADVWWDSWEFENALLQKVDKHQLRILAMGRLAQISAINVNIIIRGFENMYAMRNVPTDNMKQWAAGVEKHVKDQRVNFTRWILTRWPTETMGNMAGMPTSEFENFFFKSVLLDYAKMSAAMSPLVQLMQQTKKVKIVGPGDTNITFSIKDIPVVKCDGTRNIPDGEVYTAPVRESMNGIIHYNTATVSKDGHDFSGIRFEVKGGEIVEAMCESGNVDKLNEILDTDDGSRYFGEFAIGVNPFILHPIKETLFDEKIAGSFHLTPGQCYDVAPNGNDSTIHWDLIAIQREDYGGGSIYFDGQVIRKNGIFTLPKLRGLNPNRLMAV